MTKAVTMTLAALALSIGCGGCSRAVSEGMGVAMGASGKVVDGGVTPDLTRYKGFRVDPITVGSDLSVPPDMPTMIQTDLAAVAAARGLVSAGEPALILSGEIVHYETASTVDTAIGPLAEVIVRTKIVDAATGNVLSRANYVSRSKATMSSSPKDLSAGIGKALDKWLKAGGLKKAGEKDKE